MSTVTSKDGTRIAYDKVGKGPAVILVNGALVHRAFWGHGPLAALLEDQFTVYTYDRRGRGESGDTLLYAVEREIEDLEAIIEVAGEPACLYGDSSGAALVLEAALALGDKVKKIAMYEAPYNDDPAAQQAWRDYTRQLDSLLAAHRRTDAIALFMRITGASDADVEGARGLPFWPEFEAVAQTLAYDHSGILGEDASVPIRRAASLAVPALVMDGGESYPFMHATAVALANAMPLGQHRTLEGQTHEVVPEAMAPVLAEFFAPGPSARQQVPSQPSAAA